MQLKRSVAVVATVLASAALTGSAVAAVPPPELPQPSGSAVAADLRTPDARDAGRPAPPPAASDLRTPDARAAALPAPPESSPVAAPRIDGGGIDLVWTLAGALAAGMLVLLIAVGRRHRRAPLVLRG